jgi:hypothetical protein
MLDWRYSHSGYDELYLVGYKQCVVQQKSTDVLEEHITCIFRVEKISQARNQHEASSKQSYRVATLMEEKSCEFNGICSTAILVPIMC